LSERGPERVPVTRLTPDLDRHLERAARLVPQATRPPTRRVVDVERPAQVVVTAGQGDVAARFEGQRAAVGAAPPCASPAPGPRPLAGPGSGRLGPGGGAAPGSPPPRPAPPTTQ